MPELTHLKSLLRMPIAELRSRQNALPELLREVNALLPILSAVPDGVVASRESGAEMVSLAQSVMKMEPLDATADPAGFNVLLAQAKSLAGSVLSQADTGDRDTLPLPLDEASSRALADAQRHGQALPLERTTVIGPDSTGPVRIDKEA
jgi:hypothetical protein